MHALLYKNGHEGWGNNKKIYYVFKIWYGDVFSENFSLEKYYKYLKKNKIKTEYLYIPYFLVVIYFFTLGVEVTNSYFCK